MTKFKLNMFFALLIFGLIIGSQKVLAQSSAWKAPPKADELSNPYKGEEKAIQAGNKIYQNLCTMCHGKTGKGDGSAGVNLKPKPADLTSKKVQQQSDGAIYWKIKEGKPPMPAFKNQLTDNQLWAIVTYINTLKDNSQTKSN